MSAGWILLLILLLTGGTLFFSVNAMALRTFSRVKLQEALKAINKEETVERIVEDAEKLLFTCASYRLIFNSCILLLWLAVFATIGQRRLQVVDYVLSLVISIAIFSIFVLAIPHAWAKYAGEKTLSRTYKLLVFFSATVQPILHIRKFFDRFVRRLAGVADTTTGKKQEEFLNGLKQRRMEGVVDKEEQQMIENVLELGETTAGEIMTPRTDIVAVEANSDRQAVLDTIIGAGHSRVPVFEGNIDNIVGLIYAKDLLSEIGKASPDFKLRDKLRDAYFVPETKPLKALLHEFQNQKLHIAVVLDEYGGTAGIITLEDVIEELVGEITDEYEKKPPEPVKKIDENIIELDARTPVDDLNDEWKLNLPEDEDYDTVGGFAFSHLGYIPKTGETFDYKNLRFTIYSAEARRIKRIRIQIINSKTTSD